MVMDDRQPSAQPVYWPRVKAILDGIMAAWEARWGREPYPGIHEYSWTRRSSSQQQSCQGTAPSNPACPVERRIWCVPWYVVSEALGRCLCTDPSWLML